MNQDERRFDFHGLGLAIKQAREERGWTQAYLAELVGKTDRTIMSIENKGQHPSFNLFFQLVTMFDISVDQFFYTEEHRGLVRLKAIFVLFFFSQTKATLL